MTQPHEQNWPALHLAYLLGRIEAKLDRVIANQDRSTTSSPRKLLAMLGEGWEAVQTVLHLMGKVVWWVAPRLVFAWAVMSGWVAAAWRWLQHFVS